MHSRNAKGTGADTVFGIDYHAYNEDKDRFGSRLSSQPQYHAAQVVAGWRAVLYPVMMDYFNDYRMPLMITETGTPYFHYGARWHQENAARGCPSRREGGDTPGLVAQMDAARSSGCGCL
jgi:hypothetical protein